MVEPAGSFILNTLLQGRSALGAHPGSIYSVSKVAMSRPTPQLTPGFFNPRPRRAPGKERMSDPSRPDLLSLYSDRCQDWSCRMRISVYCSGRLENSVEEEEPRRRSRNLRRARKPGQIIPRHPPCDRAVLPPVLHRGQTRYASHSSEQPSGKSEPPSSSSDASALEAPEESAASDPETIQPPDSQELDLPPETADPPLLDNISETDSPPSPIVDGRKRKQPPPPSPAANRLRLQDVRYLQLLIAEDTQHVQLEKLWHAYESVHMHGGLITSAELVILAEKLLGAAEKRVQINEPDELHKWGLQLRQILESIPPTAVPTETLRLMMARALVLEGNVTKAVDLLHSDMLHHDPTPAHLRTFENAIVFTWRQFDRIRALEYLISEWKAIGSHLLTETSRRHSRSPEMAAAGTSLRKTAFSITSGISLPALVMADKEHEWPKERRQHLGNFLIEAFFRAKIPTESVFVLQEMRRQGLEPAPYLTLHLVRALAREELFNDAHTLYSSLKEEEDSYDHLFTGLYLYAHEGKVAPAMEYFDRISAAGWRKPKAVVELMYAYAVEGQTAETLRVFREFFPEDAQGVPTNSPLIEHFAVGVFAHAQRGDFGGTVPWLEALRKVGLQPDAYIFTTILKSFALRGDLQSIASLLDQMRSAGTPPNLVTYSTVMTLLAHRKDPASAEAIYRRALEDGVVPDVQMISIVLNAHIEAGSWKGVIRAFDFIRTAPHMKLTIKLYNLLLKAYLLIGAPFRIVSRIFRQIERLRIRPDGYTFALLIQSACDARRLDIATDIFAEMDRLAERWGSTRHITTWTMTTIMAGFLRKGERDRAMEVYQDMGRRGLKPSAITYGLIVSAYGREGTEESFKLAEDFIHEIADTPPDGRDWDTPAYGRWSARDHLYLPLMQAYSSRRMPEEVERLFQTMLKDGGEPNLTMMLTLMDAYARTRDTDNVRRIWPQIFNLGVKYSTIPLFPNDSEAQRSAKLHTFVLCLPLSQYIRTLSMAGLNDEIASVWKQFQANGFSFSADNWNQLALALMRAGEVERCFEVLEKVILPYHRRSNRLRAERDPNPDSPLSLDVAPADRRPLEGRLVGKARSEKTPTYQRRAGQSFEQGHAEDLVYHLHVLHRVSPMWNTWQPRDDVLRGLFNSVLRLRAGLPAEAAPPATPGVDVDPVALQEQTDSAHERLRVFYTTYPDAMQAVAEFESKEQRRLGRWFTQMYSRATMPE
ncbi:hypothetical protein B0H16DRAFT_1710179 [Mycena metata]|uniref:Pentacotripeptide-repeat region of PRORP domain-containing protein n=1 Tax=Mycena metata TaxID=1033252 RepID=A0AAD7K961_9AGAR|nr:hypothetical protein B0H16DRAFT_1710179 [Mycena metata]